MLGVVRRAAASVADAVVLAVAVVPRRLPSKHFVYDVVFSSSFLLPGIERGWRRLPPLICPLLCPSFLLFSFMHEQRRDTDKIFITPPFATFHDTHFL
jgi:hypothetical protein